MASVKNKTGIASNDRTIRIVIIVSIALGAQVAFLVRCHGFHHDSKPDKNKTLSPTHCRGRRLLASSVQLWAHSPEGPYTLPMELGPKKTIPILVFGT